MLSRGRFEDFHPPEIMFLLWQKPLFNWIKSRYSHIRQNGFQGETILLDGTLSHEKKTVEPRIGVSCGFGIGGPSAVLAMEAFAALGVTRFIGLGTAGGLLGQEELSLPYGDRTVKTGDIILPDRAVRDEGTSYHYLEDGEDAVPDGEERVRLENLLTDEGLTCRKGLIWTTDAFFRETEGEIDAYLKQGALAVDMEAASLYACARKRGLSAASLFVISDILTREGWAPEFHHVNIMTTMKRLFEISSGLSQTGG